MRQVCELKNRFVPIYKKVSTTKHGTPYATCPNCNNEKVPLGFRKERYFYPEHFIAQEAED